jgi:hypothetical protein
MLGIAEMTRALKGGEKQPLDPEFLVHLNEITLLIHNAGKFGVSVRPTTSFRLLEPPPEVLNVRSNYLNHCKPSFFERLLLGTVEQSHRR